jgi:hypothetical protein
MRCWDGAYQPITNGTKTLDLLTVESLMREPKLFFSRFAPTGGKRTLHVFGHGILDTLDDALDASGILSGAQEGSSCPKFGCRRQGDLGIPRVDFQAF